MSIYVNAVYCDHCDEEITSGGFVTWSTNIYRVNTKIYMLHDTCVKKFTQQHPCDMYSDLSWTRQGLAEFLQDTVNRLNRGGL